MPPNEPETPVDRIEMLEVTVAQASLRHDREIQELQKSVAELMAEVYGVRHDSTRRGILWKLEQWETTWRLTMKVGAPLYSVLLAVSIAVATSLVLWWLNLR